MLGHPSRVTMLDPKLRSLVDAHLRERAGTEAAVLSTYGHGPEVAALVDEGPRQRLWAFRFDEQQALERVLDFPDGGREAFTPAMLRTLDAYFCSYNEDHEDEHVALLHPDIVYFGAVSRITSVGIATCRGIFRGARETMGVHRLEVQRFFGRGGDVAAMVRLVNSDPSRAPAEGAWVFHLDAAAKVDRLSILWNPEGFLTRR